MLISPKLAPVVEEPSDDVLIVTPPSGPIVMPSRSRALARGLRETLKSPP